MSVIGSVVSSVVDEVVSRVVSFKSPMIKVFSFIAAYKGDDDTQNIGIDGDICNLMPKGTISATSNHSTQVYAKTAGGSYQVYEDNTPVWTGGRYTRNNARWSEDLTNDVFITYQAGLGSIPITTLISAGGPKGEDATRIQLDLNGGITTDDRSSITQSIGSEIGSPVSMAIWIKSNDANNYNVRYDFNGEIPSGGDSPIIVAGQSWVKIERTFNLATGLGNNATLRLRGGQGTSDTADILVTGWQQNNLSSVGEYVKTTDAARTVTYSTDANGLALNPHPFLQANTATTNLLFPSEPPVDSSFTIPATEHTLWIEGSGSITSSYGTATEVNPLVFTGNAAAELFTVVGAVTIAQIQLGSIKGAYVPTTTAAESITETDYTYPADNIDPSNATVSFQMDWAGDNVEVLDIGGGLTLRAGMIGDGDELVVNGTFDTDVDGWTEVDGTKAWVDNALEVYSPTMFDGVSQRVYITEGGTYVISHSLKAGTTNRAEFRIPTSQVNISSSTTSKQWVHRSDIRTVTEVNDFTIICRNRNTAPVAGTSYFDNISVQKAVLGLALSDGTNTVSVTAAAGIKSVSINLTAATMRLNVDGVAVSGAYIPPAAGVITCKENMWALSSRPYV